MRAKNACGEAARKFTIVCGDTLALTPHMGWNSWYIWGDRVTDKIIREAADAMVSTGMIDHGYMYVNMDDCWTVKPGSTDPDAQRPAPRRPGNILPNKRFPDMKALADYIHGKGLKAGIYTGPVDLTCCRHAGCYQHEEQDARQYRRLGVRLSQVRFLHIEQRAEDGRHSRQSSTATLCLTSLPAAT